MSTETRLARAEARANAALDAWFARLTEEDLEDLVTTGCWPERLAGAPAWVRRALSDLAAEFRAMSDEELLSLLPAAPVLPAPAARTPAGGCS